MLTKPIHLTL